MNKKIMIKSLCLRDKVARSVSPSIAEKREKFLVTELKDTSPRIGTPVIHRKKNLSSFKRRPQIPSKVLRLSEFTICVFPKLR